MLVLDLIRVDSPDRLILYIAHSVGFLPGSIQEERLVQVFNYHFGNRFILMVQASGAASSVSSATNSFKLPNKLIYIID